MSTITKEWLQQKIADMEATRDEIPFGLDEDDSNTLAAMKLALASLEAKPVAYMYKDNLHADARFSLHTRFGNWSQEDINEYEITEIPLYTAPPAPVSVSEWTNEQCLEFLSIAFRHAEIKGDLELDDIRLGVKMANGSRSAMLQGADGKPELTVWYGAMPETNGKTNWTAILHRKGECISTGITIDRSEYPDRVRYEADRMRYLIGEISEEPDILAYDADAHSGYVKPDNSPVIPDGLRLALSNAGIAAPESDEMLAATCEKYIQALVTWVKERQPFKSAVIPDGWVACSERMPEQFKAILAFNEYGEVWSGAYDRYWNFYCDNLLVEHVTHWMPLPAAPQQEVK